MRHTHRVVIAKKQQDCGSSDKLEDFWLKEETMVFEANSTTATLIIMKSKEHITSSFL